MRYSLAIWAVSFVSKWDLPNKSQKFAKILDSHVRFIVRTMAQSGLCPVNFNTDSVQGAIDKSHPHPFKRACQITWIGVGSLTWTWIITGTDVPFYMDPWTTLDHHEAGSAINNALSGRSYPTRERSEWLKYDELAWNNWILSCLCSVLITDQHRSTHGWWYSVVIAS